MTDNKDVLDYLREQFARVHARFDRIDADILNLKVRMSAVEVELGHLAYRHRRGERADRPHGIAP